MPFGLTNAPASFQGYINKILAEKLDIFVIVYLDNILIYTNDDGDGHVSAVQWVLEQLRKFSLFANLKKCRFHQEEVRFLGYVVSSKGIRMEDERIEAVKQWPEPQSVRDIQVFLGFANFYRRFIQGFSRIAAPFTSMLKTSGSTESKIQPGDGGVGIGVSRAGLEGSKLDGSELHGNEVDGGEVEDDEIGEKVQKRSKSKNSSKSKKTIRSLDFLTPGAKLAFTKLRQAFFKALILHHFDPKCHIWIETDALGYAIGEVLSQLISDNSGQWYPVAFFFRKMILAETRYETHNSELLAIVEAFKTWRHYLEGSRLEVLVLTNHNNLRQFMDMKSLSSRQVCWAQKLSRYHFRIDYCQGKANGAADALSRYPQRNAEEEVALRAENVKILHRLQSSLTNASLSRLSISAKLSPLHRVLICGTHVLPQRRQFWDTFRTELDAKGPYQVSIGAMRLRLSELQENDDEAKLLRGSADLPEGWEDVEGVLQYQGLPYVPEIIRSEVISRHHDDPLAGHFGIDKTRELISRKYYWPSLRRDVKSYVRGYDICLASKAVCHKPYGDLQSLPVPTH